MYSHFSDLCKARVVTRDKLDLVKSDLDHYKRVGVADLDDDTLEWWKGNHTYYPLLAELVRKLWSLPATSVRSEEVFSVAGMILTEKRNRLLPSNVTLLTNVTRYQSNIVTVMSIILRNIITSNEVINLVSNPLSNA